MRTTDVVDGGAPADAPCIGGDTPRRCSNSHFAVGSSPLGQGVLSLVVAERPCNGIRLVQGEHARAAFCAR